MAVAAANPWWWDVLARAGARRSPPTSTSTGRSTRGGPLPVLGRSLAAVIADGELSVAFEAGVAVLSYYHHRFPIGPGTPVRLVRSLLSVRPEPSPEGIPAEGTSADESSEDDSSADDGSADDCYADDAAPTTATPTTATPTTATPTTATPTTWPSCSATSITDWPPGASAATRGTIGDSSTWTDWSVVRVEDPAVYEGNPRAAPPAGRRRPCRRAEGRPRRRYLAHPTRYLAQLGHDLDRGERSRPVLLVEKILARGTRTFPSLWTVDGTTGYEFVDLVGSLLVDGDGAEAIAKLAADWACDDRPFDHLVTASKRFVQASLFPGQVARLTDLVAWRLSRPPGGHDLARPDLSRALVELAAQLGVYRTYVDATGATGEDRRRLQQAAIGARPNLDADGQRAMDLIPPAAGRRRARRPRSGYHRVLRPRSGYRRVLRPRSGCRRARRPRAGPAMAAAHRRGRRRRAWRTPLSTAR